VTRRWLVRVVVDTDGHATEQIVGRLRERLTSWHEFAVEADGPGFIRVTACTDPATSSEAQEIGAYLESVVRAVCWESGQCEYAVVRLMSVE
jgi:hypothetical protein